MRAVIYERHEFHRDETEHRTAPLAEFVLECPLSDLPRRNSTEACPQRGVNQ